MAFMVTFENCQADRWCTDGPGLHAPISCIGSSNLLSSFENETIHTAPPQVSPLYLEFPTNSTLSDTDASGVPAEPEQAPKPPEDAAKEALEAEPALLEDPVTEEQSRDDCAQVGTLLGWLPTAADRGALLDDA